MKKLISAMTSRDSIGPSATRRKPANQAGKNTKIAPQEPKSVTSDGSRGEPANASRRSMLVGNVGIVGDRYP